MFKLKYEQPFGFKGHNKVIAEEQPAYIPLPAHVTDSGRVTCCWKIGLWNRVKLLFTGKVWLVLLTFNDPLQPHHILTDKPVLE